MAAVTWLGTFFLPEELKELRIAAARILGHDSRHSMTVVELGPFESSIRTHARLQCENCDAGLRLRREASSSFAWELWGTKEDSHNCAVLNACKKENSN
jgi:hypothetical protein